MHVRAFLITVANCTLDSDKPRAIEQSHGGSGAGMQHGIAKHTERSRYQIDLIRSFSSQSFETFRANISRLCSDVSMDVTITKALFLCLRHYSAITKQSES